MYLSKVHCKALSKQYKKVLSAHGLNDMTSYELVLFKKME